MFDKYDHKFLFAASIFFITFLTHISTNVLVNDIVIASTVITGVIFLCTSRIVGAIEERKS